MADWVPLRDVVDALGVLGLRHTVVEVLLHLLSNIGGVGEQHGTGKLIMLGLSDEVGGQQARISGLISDDADFSRTGNRIDAYECGNKRLGGGHEDVARAVILSTGSHNTSPS